MKNKIKIIIYCFLLVSSFLFINNSVLAAGNYGLDDAASPSNLVSKTTFADRIGQIIGVALSFLGVAFFILMIYGGFLWMFARGNDQEVSKAKDIIISAVIGLVIVLSAYAITTYLGGIL